MLFLALIYLAFISLGLPDSLLGSAWPLMNIDLDVAIESAGYISMAVSCCTIVSSLFSHKLIARLGIGKIMVASVGMTAFALLGFSLSPSFITLVLFSIPLGLGAGAVDSGLNEFVAEHYEARHMSWLHCFWGVGAMLGPMFISVMTHKGHNWRSGYFAISVIQFVLVLLLLFSLPMWKKVALESASLSEEETPQKPSGIFASLQVKGVTFALILFFLYCSAESTVMLWGSSYLVTQKNISPEKAAAWISFFFLGLTLGRAASGFITMRIANERLIHLGIGILFAGIAMLFVPISPVFTLCAFILIGVGLAPIFPAMLHQTPTYFGKHNAQAIMGLQMASAYTGTTIMPPLFGQFFSHVSFVYFPFVLLACAMGLLFCSWRLSFLPSSLRTIHT